MSIQNKTIPGIDLPVYEFLRPNALFGGANTTAVSLQNGKDQFMYGVREGQSLRYDAYSDVWLNLPSFPQTNNNLPTMTMNTKGYTGQVISATLSSVFIAAANNTKTLVGKKIRIINGPGKNQECVIKDVVGPTVDATFVVTAATNNAGTNAGTIFVTDSSLSMAINQFKGYEIKFIGNATGYNQVRPILYNNANTLQLADPALAGVMSTWGGGGFTTPATNQIGLIQKSEVILETNWSVQPTSDSYFEVVGTGQVYYFANINTPFSFFEYDRFSDLWYYKTVNPNRSGQFGTDYALETTFVSETPSVSSKVTAATFNTFSDSLCSVSFETYKNYQVKITNGTGTGQIRNILSAGPVGYTVEPWDTVPDTTSVYEIQNPDRSLFLISNAEGRLYRYDIEMDSWFNQSQVLAYGFVSNLIANNSAVSGVGGIPITSITRVGTTATVTTARPHLLTGTPTLSISASTDPLYNGAFVCTPNASNTFTYTMAGTPAASPAVASNTITTNIIFDLNQNWIPNQFVGQVLMVHNGVQTNQVPSILLRYITANTRNSITVNTALSFTPANGSRYFVLPITAIGRDRIEGDAANKLTYGLCTASGTTTLTDSTKSWKTNIHAGKRLLVIAGTGAGTEVGISTNTATVLTLAASVTTDTTSVYVIINNLVNAGGCNLKYASNTSQDKGKFLYYHRGGNSTMFEIKYDISRETFEQVNNFHPLFGTSTTNTGQCAVYDYGDRLYFNPGSNNRGVFYYDLVKDVTYGAGLYPYASNNQNYTGMRNMLLLNVEGVKFIYMVRMGNTSDWYRFMVTY